MMVMKVYVVLYQTTACIPCHNGCTELYLVPARPSASISFQMMRTTEGVVGTGWILVCHFCGITVSMGFRLTF
ncbi:hypothetical protein OUZ56_029454 [Daphnia magna]|uniref:Secreted protein n=1 Tax=Daphnia magna TaxID=35525 RepID=A0ABR0B6V8_9CRUS|nr:hypothetical protein OUZ56_029454 [Daphnia magna]